MKNIKLVLKLSLDFSTINPNNIKLLTDVNMKFKNISMKNFTPYTAKFVGRAIKDGKLGDIGPTVLKIMGIEIPSIMTGNCLV